MNLAPRVLPLSGRPGPAARGPLAADVPLAAGASPVGAGLPVPAGSPGAQGAAGRLPGIGLMTGSAVSNQLGAALAALAFPVLGPAGVVAVRQWTAAALLLTAVRPRYASLALALVFATMNLSLYIAVDRIGLGLAVTLEFLGPLSIALLASYRPGQHRVEWHRLERHRARTLGCALLAGAAVVVLARPQPSTDYAGIALALLAAACWACYIRVNQVVGARVPGAQGPAAAAGLSALLYVPIGAWALAVRPPTTAALGHAAAAGLLCSALPMVGDVLALRRVPAGFFGVFMSVNPVFAALAGLVILGQSLGLTDWLAITVIVAVNAVTAARPAGAAHPERPACPAALLAEPGPPIAVDSVKDYR
jgi:inner membrane transporter RhtA